MIIRKAKTGEENKIAQIYMEDAIHDHATYDEAEQVLERLKNDFLEIPQNRVAFIALDGKAPIATVQFVFSDVENDHQLADGESVGQIQYLRVRYDHHKKGIGKQLVEEVERFAKQKKFQRITLAVSDWNTNAIEFYKHLHFEFLKEKVMDDNEKLLYFFKDLGN